MKREVVVDIERCYDCPLLGIRAGVQCVARTCPHFGESCETDGSVGQDIKLNLQLEGWFAECPKWRYLGE